MKQVYEVATQIFDVALSGLSSKQASSQAPTDVIPELIRAIAANEVSPNVVGLSKSTGLTIDAVAAGIRDAISTGLIAIDSKDPDKSTYLVTSLGRELL